MLSPRAAPGDDAVPARVMARRSLGVCSKSVPGGGKRGGMSAGCPGAGGLACVLWVLRWAHAGGTGWACAGGVGMRWWGGHGLV